MPIPGAVLLSADNLQVALYAISRHADHSGWVSATRVDILGGGSLELDPDTKATLNRQNLGVLFVPALQLIEALGDVRVHSRIICRVRTRQIDHSLYDQRLGSVQLASTYAGLARQMDELLTAQSIAALGRT